MDLKITPSGQTIVKPTALGPVANTDTKLLIYGLFQKGRVLAQDAVAQGRIERLLGHTVRRVDVADDHPGFINVDTYGKTLGPPVDRHRLVPRPLENLGKDILPVLIGRTSGTHLPKRQAEDGKSRDAAWRDLHR